MTLNRDYHVPRLSFTTPSFYQDYLVCAKCENNLFQWRYDKVRSRVIKWELALNRLKETAAKRHVEICHVQSAIWSLYSKICMSKGLVIDVPVDDFEQQLVVIMRALLELRRIYKIAQRKSREK